MKKDTIYREDAIEAIRRLPNAGIHWYVSAEAVFDALLKLPSAQPEIIHCRDCEFTDGEKPIADGRYWCVLHGGFMYFCSDAKRRTDR